MSSPHYRSTWFLALGHLSKGVGWTAHDAALSWLRDNGQQRLPKFALTSALASIPSRLHKVAVGALLMVGLWVETPEGYEVRGAPAPERSTPAALMQQEARRESERERAAARKRAQRDRERQGREAGSPASPPASSPVGRPLSSGRDLGVTAPVPSPVTGGVTAPVTSPVTGVTSPVTEGVTSPVTGALEGVTGPVTAPLSRRDIPSLSSSSSGENSLSGEAYSEERGVQGGATAGVTLDVTAPPVTPEVTASVTPDVTTPAAAPVTTPIPGRVAAPVATPSAAPEPSRSVPAPSPARDSRPSFASEAPTGPLSSPPASAPVPQAPAAQAPSTAPAGASASAAPKRRPRRPQPEMTPEVREVFEYWRNKLMPGAEPITERIQLIQARLAAGRSVDDICRAIDGVARSDWHQAKGHIDLTLICRADKFDQYLAWGRGTADPNAAPSSFKGAASRPARTAPPQPVSPGRPKLRWGKLDNEEDFEGFDENGDPIDPVEEAS